MESFTTLRMGAGSGVLLVCDHASNRLPAGYGTLGLTQEAFERHIGYDIGAAQLARALSARLDAPAILGGYSRLLIDLNRGAEDPTLIMALSDGALIPGNHPLPAEERARRLALYYEPYHAAISAALDTMLARGLEPKIISLHSFTPVWRGRARPWHVGVLWNKDGRLAHPLLEALRAEADLVVGDNEPYSGELEDDCMDRHGTKRGLPHVLIEIRQDLLGTVAGIAAWADLLARAIRQSIGA